MLSASGAAVGDAERYRVAIVGGGPVGLALGIDLAQRGVRCVVIERRGEVSRIPKGQNLYQRTLEHLWSWGIEAEIRRSREVPAGYPIGGITAYRSLAGGHWYLPPLPGDVNAYYYQANERLPQYRTEEVLRRRAGGLDGVDLLARHLVSAIELGDEGVRVRVGPGAPGEAEPRSVDPGAMQEVMEKVIEAEYLVGCDGAHSFVREQLGVERRGRDFDQQMALCVFRSRELHDLLTRFPERTTYRVLHPDFGGAWLFFGRVDLGERWFFHGPVPRGTSASDHAVVRALMHLAAGSDFACEIEHVGFFELRCDVAGEYRRGRVFLAGDACHSHPPYGGLGLNTGLDDVANLGWKLAAALHGWGGEPLLDSYGLERQVIGEETSAMIAGWIEAEADFLGRYRPERDRAEFEQAWSRRTDGETVPAWYEPHYEGSPVVCASPTGPARPLRPDRCCGIRGEHRFDARPGHHLAPYRVEGGSDVFERLGAGLALVSFAGDGTVAARLEAAARRRGVPLSVVSEPHPGGHRHYRCDYILVRPDRYVAWCGDEVPDDADALVRRVTGQEAG